MLNQKISVRILISWLFLGFSAVQAGTWEYSFSKGTDWKKDWKVVSGIFELDRNGLIQLDRGEYDFDARRAIAQTDWEMKSATIEARIRHDKKATGYNDAAIYYRMSDDDNGFCTRIQLDDYVTIGRVKDGAYSHLEIVKTAIDPGVWYDVKIVVKGSRIKVYLNGEEMLDAKSDHSSKGRVGFGMVRSTENAYLSDIKVTGTGVKPSL